MLTRKEFAEYVKCQNAGYWNMLDYRAWSTVTFLTKEQWLDAIKNYTVYINKYGY